MKSVVLIALSVGFIANSFCANTAHQDPAGSNDGAHPETKPKKTYTLREQDEKGDEVIVESSERCVVRVKNGIRYLYDIADDKVIYTPEWTVADVILTQNRTEDERDQPTDTSHFQFRLIPTPRSLEEFKKLRELFPGAKKMNLPGGKVRLRTRDWKKPVAEIEIRAPEKVQLREATDEDQVFHIDLDANDAGFLLGQEAAREAFPVNVEVKTPCAETRPDKPALVAFNPAAPAQQILHYQREEQYGYPSSVIEPVQKLLRKLGEERENPEKSLATARKILEVFRDSPTEKDREIIKALGYADLDAAIEGALKRPRARNNLVFAMNFFCAGKMSCLANLLYSSRIEHMRKPQNFAKKDLKIDILNPEEWDKLVRAESYDEVKVFEKFKNDRAKVLTYTKDELDKLEKIYNLPNKKVSRSIVTSQWDAAHPDDVSTQTKFEAVKP